MISLCFLSLLRSEIFSFEIDSKSNLQLNQSLELWRFLIVSFRIMTIQKWFTIIEMLIFIGIMAILISALYPALGNYHNRAKKTEAKLEMRQISQYIINAHTTQSKAVRWITGNNCSNCPCRSDQGYTWSLLSIPDTHACYQNWKNAIDSILVAGWVASGSLAGLYRDPWNVPYMLDENEDESPWVCDALMSSFGSTQTNSWDIYSIAIQTSNWNQCN